MQENNQGRGQDLDGYLQEVASSWPWVDFSDSAQGPPQEAFHEDYPSHLSAEAGRKGLQARAKDVQDRSWCSGSANILKTPHPHPTTLQFLGRSCCNDDMQMLLPSDNIDHSMCARSCLIIFGWAGLHRFVSQPRGIEAEDEVCQGA